MPELFYSNATETELPIIVSIYNQTIPGRMVTADMEPVTVQSRLHWLQKHSLEKRPLYVVKNENDAVLGWVSFQDFYGRPAYAATSEISIYLDAAQHGKGYGKQILLDCISKGPQLGIKNLVGFIFAHNIPSINLFRSCGFEDWGLLPNVAELDGVERSLKIVGRRV